MVGAGRIEGGLSIYDMALRLGSERVTMKESGLTEDQFKRLDTNGDGVLSGKEMEEYFKYLMNK